MAYEYIQISARIMPMYRVLDRRVQLEIAKEETLARSAPMLLRELLCLIEFLERDNVLTTQSAVFRCVLASAKSAVVIATTPAVPHD